MKKTRLLAIVFIFLLSHCAQDFQNTPPAPDSSTSPAVQVEDDLVKSTGENGCTRNTITPDEGKYHRDQFGTAFKTWLKSKGYSTYTKTFYASTSPQSTVKSFSGWGGANEGTTACKPTHNPVIFIHGNTDSAQDWAFNGPLAAIGAPRQDFVNSGFNANEIYALSVNSPNAMSVTNNHHPKDQIEKIKNFILAVKTYTGKAKVSIIAHSLGVTMARRAIYDYNLTSSIDVFVGIAGANAGLTACGTYPAPMVPTKTCGAYFFWGWPIYVDGLAINSPHLLKMMGKKLATRLYSIRGINDELNMANLPSGYFSAADDNIWVNTTSGHYGLMHSTGRLQVELVTGN